MPARFLLFAVLGWPAAGSAAEILSVSVEKEQGVYYVESEVWIDAELQPVYEVFADWDVAEQFSSFIVESRDLAPDGDGNAGFYVSNRGCLLFFCKTVVRTGTVQAEPHEVLRATADPERSDFHLSEESWTFRVEREGTVVLYRNRMKPKFWIPPAIGTWMMKRKLQRDGGQAMERIEAIAQDWNIDRE
ncbi:MAG: SRPBCC family protein [Woeseiaceae bacterium]|nr:SRPBCC family protein [Woeseiaceae bacterium]